MSSVTSDAKFTSRILSVPYCLELFTSIYLYFMRQGMSFLHKFQHSKDCAMVFWVTMDLQAKAIMIRAHGKDVWVLTFVPLKEAALREGGKQLMYKNTIKAANVTLGVCTVQLLEFWCWPYCPFLLCWCFFSLFCTKIFCNKYGTVL